MSRSSPQRVAYGDPERSEGDEAISGWVSEGLLRSPEATLLLDPGGRLAVAGRTDVGTGFQTCPKKTPRQTDLDVARSVPTLTVLPRHCEEHSDVAISGWGGQLCFGGISTRSVSE